MIRNHSFFAGVLLLVLCAAAPAHAARWEIDPAHSTAQFSVRHMMVSNVRGAFDKMSGAVEFDEKDPARSSVEATIEAASVDTREPKRDAHLRSSDFLYAEKFPAITFKSKRVARADDGGYRVAGDLTIRGVTHEVTLAVQKPSAEIRDPSGNARVGTTATTKISRKEFGLLWNKTIEAGGVVAGDEVTITIEVELVCKK